MNIGPPREILQYRESTKSRINKIRERLITNIDELLQGSQVIF